MHHTLQMTLTMHHALQMTPTMHHTLQMTLIMHQIQVSFTSFQRMTIASEKPYLGISHFFIEHRKYFYNDMKIL